MFIPRWNFEFARMNKKLQSVSQTQSRKSQSLSSCHAQVGSLWKEMKIGRSSLSPCTSSTPRLLEVKPLQARSDFRSQHPPPRADLPVEWRLWLWIWVLKDILIVSLWQIVMWLSSIYRYKKSQIKSSVYFNGFLSLLNVIAFPSIRVLSFASL